METVAHKHGVSVSTAAAALGTLTTRTVDDSDADALAVADLAWGRLVDDTCAPPLALMRAVTCLSRQVSAMAGQHPGFLCEARTWP